MKHFLTISLAAFASVLYMTLSPTDLYENEMYTSVPTRSSPERGHTGTTENTQRLSGTVTFRSPKEMLYMRLPASMAVSNVRWNVAGTWYEGHLDHSENEQSSIGEGHYTFPITVPSTRSVSYELEGNFWGTQEITVGGLNVQDRGWQLSWKEFLPEKALAAWIAIVTRSGWGADEWLTYRDDLRWVERFEKQASREKTEPTPAQIAAAKRDREIRTYLLETYPETQSSVSSQRTENDHPLLWNIWKTQYVRSIVVHHTAENNNSSLSDADILRGIYYYHSVVRGWGDIGYNYIVGRDGTIYEGRKGGLYTVWAHAQWNNPSSVGIAVMGDFNAHELSAEQEAGLTRIIQHLARTYGIDVNAQATGYRECRSDEACLMRDFTIPALTEHRVVVDTSCPWKNLHDAIPRIRKSLASETKGLVAVSNPQSAVPEPSTLTGNLWPDIRILLSFTGRTATLESPGRTPMTLTYPSNRNLSNAATVKFIAFPGNRLRVIAGKNATTVRGSVTLSGSVLRVANWNRRPNWDTSGKYNDNLFRGSLTISSSGGRLQIINTLPIEAYLRWLWEVSPTDAAEKSKAILVSARGYALWYTDPNNRKFAWVNTYDGSDDPNVFQRYLWYGFESRAGKVSEYVQSTHGEVVTFSGKLIKPWYFSASAEGRTLSYKEYCERQRERLKKPSAVCDDVSYLQSVQDPGIFLGRTWAGHGVGLSGAGAEYLATEAKWGYQRIIEYFFSGATVSKLY